MADRRNSSSVTAPRHGVARVISKLGMGSRTQAGQWVRAGRVQVNGRMVCDAEFPVVQGLDRIAVDGRPLQASGRMVVMLNKPRGLVTTASDEQGRETVYSCFAGASLPWFAPVGRLDKASEGLLLFSNDPAWAARINEPKSAPDKTYHVQIDQLLAVTQLRDIQQGALVGGESLTAKSVRILRSGDQHSWLEIVVNEGRNRQIRRLLSAFEISVLRLVRVAVGPLPLGDLPKGKWRQLTAMEIDSL